MSKNKKRSKLEPKTPKKESETPDATQPSYGGYQKVDWDTCWALQRPDGSIVPMPESQIDEILELAKIRSGEE